MKKAIIVPVYNEEKRAVETVKRILKVTKSMTVVVDDGSTDDSYKMLVDNFDRSDQVVVLRHVVNLGKGAAMKTGVDMAWKLGAKAVVFVDADGQHKPELLPKFEKALEKSNLVFGYRMMDQRMPLIRKWGNILAKEVVGYLFNIRRKDLLCGYLGFSKKVYPKIKWKSARYGIETEMATRVGKNRLAFEEIKVDTIYIDKYKGVNMFDAIKILFNIPAWYFSK